MDRFIGNLERKCGSLGRSTWWNSPLLAHELPPRESDWRRYAAVPGARTKDNTPTHPRLHTEMCTHVHLTAQRSFWNAYISIKGQLTWIFVCMVAHRATCFHRIVRHICRRCLSVLFPIPFAIILFLDSTMKTLKWRLSGRKLAVRFFPRFLCVWKGFNWRWIHWRILEKYALFVWKIRLF